MNRLHFLRHWLDAFARYPVAQKSPKTFQILGQNTNGISPKNDFNKWHEILQSTISHEIDYLNLYETNTNWNHAIASTKITDITRRFFSISRLSTSTSSIRFDHVYKPGSCGKIAKTFALAREAGKTIFKLRNVIINDSSDNGHTPANLR